MCVNLKKNEKLYKMDKRKREVSYHGMIFYLSPDIAERLHALLSQVDSPLTSKLVNLGPGSKSKVIPW